MSDQPSVFSNEPPTKALESDPQAQEGNVPQSEGSPSQQPTASSDNLWADQLASIKNERGEPKYKDLPTALDALRHSQEYIPNLKGENETLKQTVERLTRELEERKNLEETIERLTSPKQESTPPGEQALSEEKIAALLEQRLNAYEQEKIQTSNARQVEAALVERYGDKAREVVQQKCEEYGMTPAQMEALARTNPKAVTALFEVKPSPQGKPTTSSINIPPSRSPQEEQIKAPEKSLLTGATTKDQVEFIRKIRESVYREHGISE